MARFTLHAVAPDRPGIVAAVTQALAELGCNLEDSRMSLLRGQFSIVLVLEAPGVANGWVIEQALSPFLEELALQLMVRPVTEVTEGLPGTFVSLAVRGADHPGTVARIARAVAAAGGDIVDLVGHVAADGGETPSQLSLTVAVPPEAIPRLRSGIESIAEELSMHCDVHEGASRPR